MRRGVGWGWGGGVKEEVGGGRKEEKQNRADEGRDSEEHIIIMLPITGAVSSNQNVVK